MKRASFSCCNFLCIVLAAAYLKYRRCRLSCFPFVWHFFHCDTHTHTLLCVVLASAHLKYCWCCLSCLPFAWPFLFVVTHVHAHTLKDYRNVLQTVIVGKTITDHSKFSEVTIKNKGEIIWWPLSRVIYPLRAQHTHFFNDCNRKYQYGQSRLTTSWTATAKKAARGEMRPNERVAQSANTTVTYGCVQGNSSWTYQSKKKTTQNKCETFVFLLAHEHAVADTCSSQMHM